MSASQSFPASLEATGIYAIRNTLNGRVYIGSSSRAVLVRWTEHRKLLRAGRHHSLTLQRSWSKHGEAAFEILLIEAVADLSKLVEREQFWIDAHRSTDKRFGFNRWPVAGGGRVYTAETRAKMAAAKIGTKHSADTKAKMSKSRTGRVFSAETRLKFSAWQKGQRRKPHTEEHKAKISAGGKGKKRTLETRQRIAIAAVAREAAKRLARFS